MWEEDSSTADDTWKDTQTTVAEDPRHAKFEELLSVPIVDIDALRKCSWRGVVPSLRGTTWMLLLEYLPLTEERRQSTLERKRREYLDGCKEFYDDVSDGDRTEFEMKNLIQIRKDMPRVNDSVPLFRCPEVQQMLERLLYVWALHHPASGYVQGIDGIATPFFAVLLQTELGKPLGHTLELTTLEGVPSDLLANVEADTYHCLSKLLDSIQDNYTADQPGIQRMILELSGVMQRMDPALCAHFEELGIQFMHFSFRWMNCLFLRELPLQRIARMFDAYLSETDTSLSTFHVYVCAATLVRFSKDLMKLDYTDSLGFLQNLPTDQWSDNDIDILLSEAYVARIRYQNSHC